MGLSNDPTVRKLAGLSDGVAVDRVRVRVLPDGRLTREDAARYVGLSSKTLANLAGDGPRAVKIRGRVFYYLADLDTFIRGEAA